MFDNTCEETFHEKGFAKLATAGRHKNVHVVYVQQNLFQQSKQSRTIDLNTTHLIKNTNPLEPNCNRMRRRYKVHVCLCQNRYNVFFCKAIQSFQTISYYLLLKSSYFEVLLVIMNKTKTNTTTNAEKEFADCHFDISQNSKSLCVLLSSTVGYMIQNPKL